MKNKTIHVSKELDIPFEIVTRKTSMMGGNGGGKTYAAMKIIEEILRANGWVIIFDPVGIHWGLRLKADGKTPSGLDIPIFGGLHADVQILPEAGAMVADLLFDRRLSAILDVSQFESDTDVTRFSHDFMKRFYFRMKTQKRAVLIVLEECQEFVPQIPQKGEEKKLHVFARAAKLGRNYGIGFMFISQRPQEISKKVLNLTQAMFAFNMTGTQERKAMDEWFTYAGIEAERISSILPTLATGYPYLVSPAWLKFRGQIKILPKFTFDSSSTPDFDDDETKPVSLSPIDISEIEKTMGTLIQKAKDDDPAELRKTIKKLERELLQARNETKPAPVQDPIIQKVEIPIIDKDTFAFLETMQDENENLVRAFSISAERIDKALGAVSETARRALEDMRSRKSIPTEPARRADPIPARAPARQTQPSPIKGDSTIQPGARKILTACAQYPEGLSRDQISVLVGYKRSSRDTYITRLSSAGYVVVSNGLVFATPDGIEFLGEDYEPLPTGYALRSYWMERLPLGERALLTVIIHQHPNDINRDDLSQITNYKRSSRDTYLTRLMARRLITSPRPGYVRASETLFG